MSVVHTHVAVLPALTIMVLRMRLKDLTIITTLLIGGIACFWQALAPSETHHTKSLQVTPVSFEPVPQHEVLPQAIETVRVGQRVSDGRATAAVLAFPVTLVVIIGLEISVLLIFMDLNIGFKFGSGFDNLNYMCRC